MTSRSPALDDTEGHVVRGTDGVVAALVTFAEQDPDRVLVGDLRVRLTARELLERAVPVARALLEADGAGAVVIAPRDPVGLAVGMAAAAAVGRPVTVSHRAERGLDPGGGPTGGHDPVGDFAAIAARRPPSHVIVGATTSGSTSDPRPVGVTSFGQFVPLRGAHAARPFSATSATACDLWHHVLSGGRVTCFDLGTEPVPVMLERLSGAGVEVLSTVPSVLRRLGAAPHAGSLPYVGIIAVSGEPLGWSDVAAARSLTVGRAEVRNNYGAMEIHRVCQRAVPPGEPLGTGVVPVGPPLPGRSVTVEVEGGAPATPGTVGRLILDGPFDRVVDPPLQRLPDGRLRFRSGDAGHLDAAGALHLAGRIDRTVKVRGLRVEPALLEDLLRRCPGVVDAAVLPVRTGAEEVRLVAHVVVGARPPAVGELRAALIEHVPDVLVPARFELRQQPFPLLPGGKLDARALTGA